jgi:hypothetical protein
MLSAVLGPVEVNTNIIARQFTLLKRETVQRDHTAWEGRVTHITYHQYWFLSSQHDNGKRMKIYLVLMTEWMPDSRCLLTKDVIKKLAFSLMQRGSSMWTWAALHPGSIINM